MGDFDITYESFKTGERQGSATSVQLPEYAGKLVVIRALDSNAGNVYIGDSTSVTVPDGTTDTTSGIELSPGDWMPFYVSNLNLLWMICNNAGDDITYIVYR